ncbi:hypothetical protein IGI04_021561 [Brassica rapa subsp. trilocularis]|uniref:RNase H type-1 domain-containing protein n=1 Tax=Brassica rapa subsp. trilocularis TaxID=1813537 RepID=A0ABQ7LYF6_BRACM|nr:hypothetical protein IGI04_021561 [Brassica rapa subsp. trilocularis]
MEWSRNQCLPPTGILTGSLFPWIMWNLWKARNRFVFEGFSATPEDTLSSAIVLAREWNEGHKLENNLKRKHPQAEVVSPVNTAIVRSDAAWAEQRNCAGLGWVLFAEDQIIQFSEQKAFVNSPLIAEGLAVRKAVLTCQRRELKKVRIESDSQTLVKALNSGASGAGLYGIVSDILKMAEAFEYVCFVWIPRERNVMADCLAKTALNVVVPLVVGEAFIASN